MTEQTTAPTALQLNDDRTVTIPVKGRDPIVLPEPCLGEMEQIYTWIIEADAETSTRAEAALEARPDDQVPLSLDVEKQVVRFSMASPYAARLVDVIKLLADEDVEVGQLYGWAGSHTTLSSMFNHWQAPLGGQVSQARMLMELLAKAGGAPATNGS
jgi:hypothetical protein